MIRTAGGEAPSSVSDSDSASDSASVSESPCRLSSRITRVRVSYYCTSFVYVWAEYVVWDAVCGMSYGVSRLEQ